MKIVYHPLAEQDIEEGCDHYRDVLPSLAEDFLAEIDRCVLDMAGQPFRYRCVRGDILECRLRRFPYALYFVLEAEVIRILIVKHHRRHPQFGMDRLTEPGQ